MKYLAEFVKGYVIGLVLMICVLTCCKAKADDEAVWLTTGEWSRHNNEDAHHYRQNNTGFGLQADLDEDRSLIAGWYNNSIHRETVYMGITWTPLHVGNAKLGLAGGMATGYDKFVPAVPIGSIYGSYEYERLGVNLFWLPSIVIAAQLKIRM